MSSGVNRSHQFGGSTLVTTGELSVERATCRARAARRSAARLAAKRMNKLEDAKKRKRNAVSTPQA
jgi:hypothetical protein